MKELLQKVVLDNTIQSYLTVLLIILAILLIKRVLSKYLAKLMFRAVGKAGKHVARESFLNLVVQPLDYFLLLVIAIITLDQLKFPRILNVNVYRVSLKAVLDAIADGVLIFVFIWLCIRIIEFIALILEQKANQTADMTDNQLIIFFKDFFKAILVIIGILMILRFSFDQDISNLLTGLSIVGAALALATRESLENLIASFIIFFDKPFNTGDLVKVNGFTGTIEKIGLRSTRIRTMEKTYISVPNKQMVDTIVDNISLRTHRKAEIKIEIGLDATTSQLTELIEAVRNLLSAKQLEGIAVHLVDTGKNAHVVNIEYLQSVEQPMQSFLQEKQENLLQIIAIMEGMKIQMAGASTDVFVTNRSAV
ncbi:mechanosensitive ion channel family protein [Sediminibacterium sp. TEGAF015]|uniref:mechanosensitive ion channel family protein n=1 Tax=Sediminibacterium sp. TEGAF015 TaxID=575378 RepID=UPI0021FB3ECD|nr:mechanosensitive ion channel family protein [Sediminibacterium sp. TEGAF015]BDQ12968.1 mechanosensitive ion channel protein MscL [Sediminibacterium sp. TEGAF015]